LNIKHEHDGVNYLIEVVIFKEPSTFGINDGRVSELKVQEQIDYADLDFLKNVPPPLIVYEHGEYIINTIDKEFLDEILAFFPNP